jgi:hypothetical protein
MSVLGAVAFGWLCLHTDETGILACSVMLLGGLLGLVRPRQAWLAALLLGLASPGTEVLAHLFRWPVPFPHGPIPGAQDWSDVAGASLALLFSTVGAAAGAACGWAISQGRDDHPSSLAP